MKNIPKKIYLQIGEDCNCKDFNEIKNEFGVVEGVTWCENKINDNDIEYTVVNKKREFKS